MTRTIMAHVAILLTASAFNNQNGWKLDADGKIEMKDGNPVYIGTDGRESVVDHSTIGRLNAEAKTHREAKEAAEAKLRAFEGLDPEAAKQAIDTVKALDAKKLIDAGEVDKVKNEISQQFQAKIAESEKAHNELKAKHHATLVDNLFASSDFVRDRIAVPADMFKAAFRENVKVGDDGKIEFYGRDGNRLMSKSKFGEFADASEAFELLVEAYPHKDTILKADSGSGSGSNGNAGNRGGSRVLKRSEFDQMAPNDKASAAAAMTKGELKIVDG